MWNYNMYQGTIGSICKIHLQERPCAKSILVGYIMLDDFVSITPAVGTHPTSDPVLTSLKLSIVEVHIQSDFHLMDHHQQS